MHKNTSQIFHKILVFPITDTYLEQLQIQEMNFQQLEDRIIIRLDPNEWINFSMILKLKQYENQIVQKQPKLRLFSRPLIKVLLSELLQILLDFKRRGFYLLDYNLEDVWIQFSIQYDLFILNKVVVLCKNTRPTEKICEKDCKIKQLIQPILNIFNSYEDILWRHSAPQNQINHIKREIPFSSYEKHYEMNYRYSLLNFFKSPFLPKVDFTNIDDEILNNTFIYEFYFYRLPINETLEVDFRQKYLLLKQKVNNYLKKFESILQQLNSDQQNDLRGQFYKIVQQKIQIRGYANSVRQFIEFKLEIINFLEKQEIFYIFFQVIQEMDCNIKQLGLLIILNDILHSIQNNTDKTQIQQSYSQYLNELNDIVHQQLLSFYRQIRDHLSLNENIEQFIIQDLDIPFILNKISMQLKIQYSEWNQDKDGLIKQAIISQQVMIKEEFFKAIEKFIKDL